MTSETYKATGAINETLTAREQAALALKLPKSGTDWLDEMIKDSNRVETARQIFINKMSQRKQTFMTKDETSEMTADLIMTTTEAENQMQGWTEEF